MLPTLIDKLYINNLSDFINYYQIFSTHVLDDDGSTKVRPWEENNGYYGILSRLVKNYAPTFIFTVKCGAVDYNYLQKEQMINHFNKNGCFTTKVLLVLCAKVRLQ
jgi:hypothetical protein